MACTMPHDGVALPRSSTCVHFQCLQFCRDSATCWPWCRFWSSWDAMAICYVGTEIGIPGYLEDGPGGYCGPYRARYGNACTFGFCWWYKCCKLDHCTFLFLFLGIFLFHGVFFLSPTVPQLTLAPQSRHTACPKCYEFWASDAAFESNTSHESPQEYI